MIFLQLRLSTIINHLSNHISIYLSSIFVSIYLYLFIHLTIHLFRARSGSGSDEAGSDVDDFIVDDEGNPIQRKKQRKKHIFDDSARQLAEDIFGVAFDYEVHNTHLWI